MRSTGYGKVVGEFIRLFGKDLDNKDKADFYLSYINRNKGKTKVTNKLSKLVDYVLEKPKKTLQGNSSIVSMSFGYDDEL
ncbi:MAG: hypothetical protein HRT53_17975 [Colwellia sp.]|nr:hypothetical protein [Colwellia sp.]